MKNIDQLEKELHNRRALVIIGLLGIAAVHILDLPAKWTETRYIAWMYIAIILGVAVGLERLVVKVSKRDYLASSLLSIAVIVGYIVNRTVGMPGAKDDIGNWFEPLGLLSLFIEAFAVWQSVTSYLVFSELEKQRAAK